MEGRSQLCFRKSSGYGVMDGRGQWEGRDGYGWKGAMALGMDGEEVTDGRIT